MQKKLKKYEFYKFIAACRKSYVEKTKIKSFPSAHFAKYNVRRMVSFSFCYKNIIFFVLFVDKSKNL